jgi:hypothetical protein
MSSVRKRISLQLVVVLLLIYLILIFVLQGVELVIRGTSVEVLRPLVFWGILLGWMFGRTNLKNWIVVLSTFLGGLLFTLLRVGGIDSAIWDLMVSSLRVVWLKVIGRFVSDANYLGYLVTEIQTRLSAVISSISIWVNDLLTGFYSYNQVSTLLSWGILLWCLAAWFSWVTRKKYQPLWGLIPSGLLLSILMTYTLEKRFLLVLLLGAGLTLVGLINFEEKRIEWKARNVPGAENVQTGFSLVVVGISAFVMLFSGMMPSIRIGVLAEPVERWLYGTDEGVESETGPEVDVLSESYNRDLYTVQRFAGLPRQKLIGSGPELTKRVVMIVSSPSSSFVESELPNVARYWRSFTYDQYTGSGWQSSQTIEVAYKPGQEIFDIQSDDFSIITQDIRLSNTLRGTLYYAGLPITLDQDVLVSWRTVSDNPIEVEDNPEFARVDLFAGKIDYTLYQVRSQIPDVSDEELRQAAAEYPAWISSRFLKLPEGVPARVYDLAVEITSQQPTPYDQAKAIETFLRGYPYNLDLPAPPIDRDIADYFLFDLQTGYCDYYATSMVVLARAKGLPARLVVGFVGGYFDEENEGYLVTEADAHTWVEIYFSGFGWIPFEPTAAQGLISDDQLSLPLPPELERPPQSTDRANPIDIPGWQVGLGAFVIYVFGIISLDFLDLRRLRLLNTNQLVLTLYARLYRYSRWLNLGHQKSDTLYEFDRKLKLKIQSLASSGMRKKRLTGGPYEINLLTDYAVKAHFSQDKLDSKNKGKIISAWRNLRGRLLYGVLLSSWDLIRNKISRTDKYPPDQDFILDGVIHE